MPSGDPRRFQGMEPFFMSTPRLRAALLALSVLALVAGRADAAATVALTDLGTIDPTGINNLGLVVGNQLVGAPGPSPIQYTYGPMAGQTIANSGVYNARGINASGQVLGSAGFGGGPTVVDPTTSSDPADTGTAGAGTPSKPVGGTSNFANAINDPGQVAGAASFGGPGHAYITGGGGLTDLGSLGGAGGASYATAVNNLGQVVGGSAITASLSSDVHAFLATAGGAMADLGTLGGKYSTAMGVNAAGQVVGGSTIAGGDLHAFLATGGRAMADLGTLGGSFSIANAINVTGQVVGNAAIADGSTHAFVYSDGQMRDLNGLLPAGSGLTLTSATAINDVGQIIGQATDAAGASHGFVLTPASLLQPAAPEPGTLAVFGFAAVGLGLRLASKRRRGA